MCGLRLGKLGSRDLGSVWENHREISCFSIAIHLLLGGHEKMEWGKEPEVENGRHNWASHSGLCSKLPVTLTNLSKLSGLQHPHLLGRATKILPAVSLVPQGVGRIREDQSQQRFELLGSKTL